MKLDEDRIYKFLEACYDSGIKDPARFLCDKQPRLYGFLRGAFPRGILPTDIDGEVEVNGKFLRLEFKHELALRNGRLPKGQMMCFEKLVKTGFFTVFMIGHDDDGTPKLLEYRRLSKGGEVEVGVIDPCGFERLREACKKWCEGTAN